MSATESLSFTDAEIPKDTSPPTTVDPGGSQFVGEYPDSTPDAPYGFKPDGTPRIRRPYAPRGSKSGGSTAPSTGGARQARTAAHLLAQMNGFVALSLGVFSLPQTAGAIADANKQFEEMAFSALENDPALVRKILSAGGSSGKAGLVMAYTGLAMAAFPAGREEVKTLRERRALEAENNDIV